MLGPQWSAPGSRIHRNHVCCPRYTSRVGKVPRRRHRGRIAYPSRYPDWTMSRHWSVDGSESRGNHPHVPATPAFLSSSFPAFFFVVFVVTSYHELKFLLIFLTGSSSSLFGILAYLPLFRSFFFLFFFFLFSFGSLTALKASFVPQSFSSFYVFKVFYFIVSFYFVYSIPLFLVNSTVAFGDSSYFTVLLELEFLENIVDLLCL